MASTPERSTSVDSDDLAAAAASVEQQLSTPGESRLSFLLQVCTCHLIQLWVEHVKNLVDSATLLEQQLWTPE